MLTGITYTSKIVRAYMSEGRDITRVIAVDHDEGERTEIDFIVDSDGTVLLTDCDHIPDWVDMDCATEAAVDHA